MMRSKDILLAYINTLSDDDCAEIYFILMDKIKPSEEVEYKMYDENINRVEEDEPLDKKLVSLSSQQIRRLLNMWGADKLKSCIKIYLDAGSKNRMLEGWNDYRQLTGWVEREYNRQNRYGKINCKGYSENTLPFPDITTKKEAMEYIKKMSMEDREDNPYVFYLRNRYKIEDIENV
jgi:hypothetical protein